MGIWDDDNAAETVKPHLSWSQISMFFRCGIQYYFRYVLGKKISPNNHLLIGIATHCTIEANLQNKMNEGTLLPREEIESRAHENAIRIVENEGLQLRKNEQPYGEKYILNEARNVSATLSLLHHDCCAPRINPVEVETSFVLNMPRFPYDIHGRIDIRETSKSNPIGTIRDTKTASRLNSHAADSDQMTLYSAYSLQKLGGFSGLALDILLNTAKPRVVIQNTIRDIRDIRTLQLRIESMCEAMRKGVFLPAPSDAWNCSEQWCGYWHQCKYARRCLQLGMVGNKKEEWEDGKAGAGREGEDGKDGDQAERRRGRKGPRQDGGAGKPRNGKRNHRKSA